MKNHGKRWNNYTKMVVISVVIEFFHSVGLLRCFFHITFFSCDPGHRRAAILPFQSMSLSRFKIWQNYIYIYAFIYIYIYIVYIYIYLYTYIYIY